MRGRWREEGTTDTTSAMFISTRHNNENTLSIQREKRLIKMVV
jgi:hypothetical protein